MQTYTPEKTATYENLVKLEYQQQCGDVMFEKDTPLDIRVIAYYSIPKSASNKKRSSMLSNQIRPTKKVDWDNLGKIICDALNKLAYYDDAQIVDAQVRKLYGEPPRVMVKIQEAMDFQ